MKLQMTNLSREKTFVVHYVYTKNVGKLLILVKFKNKDEFVYDESHMSLLALNSEGAMQ